MTDYLSIAIAISEAVGGAAAVGALLYQRNKDRKDADRKAQNLREEVARTAQVREEKREAEMDALGLRVHDIEQLDLRQFKKDFDDRKVKFDLVWEILSKELPKRLHSPHLPEFDALEELWERGPEKMSLEQLTRYRDIILSMSRKKEGDWWVFALILPPVNAEIVKRRTW